MRNRVRLFSFITSSLFCVPAILAQTNPPPSDPQELVTKQPRILSKAADRSAALDLLERARRNSNLRDITSPYAVKVSFETTGDTQTEGLGTMDELSDGGHHWRWSTQLQDSLVIRLGDEGHSYGSNPNEPVPLRIQLLRAALHWPIVRNAGASAIRAANVERDGKAMTCLLLSASIPENPAPRAWVENEYCIETATGILQMWSAAPGIYTLYDYSGAGEFHGHTFPRQVSVFEEGRLAVQARVESLEDAPNLDPKVFEPTQQMLDAGAAFTLATPNRFPLRVDPSDGPTSTFFQPVIVHATLDAQDGHVIEAESLQNSDRDLSRAATDIIRSYSFAPSGFQQEVFINVQFHLPAAQMDGPPLLHIPVRWVIWDHRVKRRPVRISPRAGG